MKKIQKSTKKRKKETKRRKERKKTNQRQKTIVRIKKTGSKQRKWKDVNKQLAHFWLKIAVSIQQQSIPATATTTLPFCSLKARHLKKTIHKLILSYAFPSSANIAGKWKYKEHRVFFSLEYSGPERMQLATCERQYTNHCHSDQLRHWPRLRH